MSELKNSFDKVAFLLILRSPKTYEALKKLLIDQGASEAIANRTVKYIHDTVRRRINQENHDGDFSELLESLDLKDAVNVIPKKPGSGMGEPED